MSVINVRLESREETIDLECRITDAPDREVDGYSGYWYSPRYLSVEITNGQVTEVRISGINTHQNSSTQGLGEIFLGHEYRHRGPSWLWDLVDKIQNTPGPDWEVQEA